MERLYCLMVPCLEVIKLFQAQLRLKFILLINVKTPTRILTFICRINYGLWSSSSEISIYLGYFSIDEQFKFHAQLSLKMFYNLAVESVLLYAICLHHNYAETFFSDH